MIWVMWPLPRSNELGEGTRPFRGLHNCAFSTTACPMIENYIPVVMQVVIACGFAGATLLVSVMLGRAGRSTGVKDDAYECGMLPIGESQPRFSVKFYLIAMLFVIFDIEVVFMYPWAVVFKDFAATHGAGIFWSMLGFVGILAVAYVYALKKGALNWKQQS